MKTYSIIHVALLVLLLSSCKKDIEPIPESNDPVFSVEGVIGNDTINVIVGDDGAYLSTIEEDLNGIKIYNGKIIKGENEYEIGIYSGFEEENATTLLELLSSDSLQVASVSNEPLLEIDKDFFFNKNQIKELRWKVNGEYAGTTNLKIYTPGIYNVTAQVTYINNSSFEVTNEMVIGFENNSTYELKYEVDNQLLNCWIEPSAGQVSSVKWYINDEFVSNQMVLFHSLSNQTYCVKAEVTFSDGTIKQRNIHINGGNPYYSLQDFGVLETQTNRFWDHNIRLNIKHNGVEYSTSNVNNSNTSFIVESISYYGKDQTGKPVYKITGQLQAKVKSKATNEILDVNLKIKMGLNIN